MDIFGAPSRFVTWLVQGQWARRLGGLGDGAQLILRSDSQFSDSLLPGLEKFALGGRNTVRGYRENELVRDNGLVGSLEVRIPIVQRRNAGFVIEIAPFADVGRSWNHNQITAEAETLPSAGAGLRLRRRNKLQAEVYWGYAFRDLGRRSDWNLQDHGIHIGVSWSLP
jgi:hemolysin activation/secretion protein